MSTALYSGHAQLSSCAKNFRTRGPLSCSGLIIFTPLSLQEFRLAIQMQYWSQSWRMLLISIFNSLNIAKDDCFYQRNRNFRAVLAQTPWLLWTLSQISRVIIRLKLLYLTKAILKISFLMESVFLLPITPHPFSWRLPAEEIIGAIM